MHLKYNNKGFTIIELMIAISIFAVVLVIATTGVITIGKMYHKNITSSRAQEATRSVIENIAQTIQFTGHSMATGGSFPGEQAVCFGYDRYTYNIGSQVGEGSRGLAYDRRPAVGECSPLSSGGTELLPNNTRLSSFRVESLNSGTFRINVKIAYGDDDLLSLTQCTSGSLTNGVCNNPSEADIATLRCKGGVVGSNFCAVSELETIVNKRVK